MGTTPGAGWQPFIKTGNGTTGERKRPELDTDGEEHGRGHRGGLKHRNTRIWLRGTYWGRTGDGELYTAQHTHHLYLVVDTSTFL